MVYLTLGAQFCSGGLVSAWFSHLGNVFILWRELIVIQRKRDILKICLILSEAIGWAISSWIQCMSLIFLPGSLHWFSWEQRMMGKRAELPEYNITKLKPIQTVRLRASEPPLTLAAFRFQLVGVKHKCPLAEWFLHASFVSLT